MTTPRPAAPLDLSGMVARLLLALLVAAVVVIAGLLLRDSNAIGFAATFLSVSVSWWILGALRGQRVGPPTVAAARLQPLVDALGDYPGGKMVAGTGFQRGLVAVGVGLGVAIGERLVAAVLLGGMSSALWQGVIALLLILLPLNIGMAWWRSRQHYTGTIFATKLFGALRQVIRPNAQPGTGVLDELSVEARVFAVGTARTLTTVAFRIVAQLVLPGLFSNDLWVALVAAVIVTAIAGGPVFASLSRTVRSSSKPQRRTDNPTINTEDSR